MMLLVTRQAGLHSFSFLIKFRTAWRGNGSTSSGLGLLRQLTIKRSPANKSTDYCVLGKSQQIFSSQKTLGYVELTVTLGTILISSIHSYNFVMVFKISGNSRMLLLMP